MKYFLFGAFSSAVMAYGISLFYGATDSTSLIGVEGSRRSLELTRSIIPKWPIYTCISVLGILFTAAFFLRMLEKVFLGEFNKKWEGLTDMNTRELVTVVPLAVLTVFLGVWPKAALDIMNTTMIHLAELFR